jgi:chromosome segregation ATPase
MVLLIKQWWGKVLAGLLVAAFIACGFGLFSLDGQRKALRSEVASLNTRSELLLKKYNEQKAMSDAMRRESQESESRNRETEDKVSKLEKEKKQLQEVIDGNEKKLSEERKSSDEAIASQKERIASLQTASDNLREESNRIIKEKNQQISQITGEREALDASLKQESFQNKRCREHNSRFAALTEELVKQYENKGVLSSVGQLEPFTQLKKVEVEKICQEYRDKIDADTLPK